ncbi:MAG: hypothetical protein ACJ0OP_03445 [Thermodesulfobacteriota bacterium]|nr:MAG: hypothetical protein EVA31_00600 [Candidatus Dadabacteria bacterium]
MSFLLLFYSNLIISAILLGLILTIHFVHYKSFKFIDIERFIEFHRFHTKNISFLVLPLMTSEAVLSITICYFYFSILSLVNLLLVALIWITTFLLQVPSHNKLSTGKSMPEIKKLISGNIYRVCLWFLKVIVSTLIIL